MRAALPGLRLRCHFHNTRNTGLANAYAAAQAARRDPGCQRGRNRRLPVRAGGNREYSHRGSALHAASIGLETGVALERLIEVANGCRSNSDAQCLGCVVKAGVFPEGWSYRCPTRSLTLVIHHRAPCRGDPLFKHGSLHELISNDEAESRLLGAHRGAHRARPARQRWRFGVKLFRVIGPQGLTRPRSVPAARTNSVPTDAGDYIAGFPESPAPRVRDRHLHAGRPHAPRRQPGQQRPAGPRQRAVDDRRAAASFIRKCRSRKTA